MTDLRPLFETILEHIPPPTGDSEQPLQILVTNVEPDDYLGPLAIGRVVAGTIRDRQDVLVCRRTGEHDAANRVGPVRLPGPGPQGRARFAAAGEIIAVAGMAGIGLGESIADADDPRPLPSLSIDEPTLSMEFAVNDSPFNGQDGRFVTSRHLRERLVREAARNLAIRLEPGTSPDRFVIHGRGELQLAVLIEQMRREGYEFCVGTPHVLTRNVDGALQEPYERALVDVAEEHLGIVVQKLGERRGVMAKMANRGTGRVRLEFDVPNRGLIGYRTQFPDRHQGHRDPYAPLKRLPALGGRHRAPGVGCAGRRPSRTRDRIRRDEPAGDAANCSSRRTRSCTTA